MMNIKMQSPFVSSTPLVGAPSLTSLFRQWVSNHQPQVAETTPLYAQLYQNWVDNHNYIEMHNQQAGQTYMLGHNRFSGMNRSEFSEWVHSGFEFSFPPYAQYAAIQNEKNIKDEKDEKGGEKEVDWRERGAVTEVKDQQQCGSCYAFSTTGGLEGAYQIKTGHLVSFSEQQILDCGDRQSGFGCHGGDMAGSYSWIGSNGGLCAESDYAYVSGETGKAGTCRECSLQKDSAVTEVLHVAPNSDTAMMSALADQPVSVAIQADERDFQFYESGVFTGTCGTNLDHGVLLVGYGTDAGGDYYIMKNSWGQSWGNHGYCYLGRGEQYNNGQGQCGVLMQGVFPKL